MAIKNGDLKIEFDKNSPPKYDSDKKTLTVKGKVIAKLPMGIQIFNNSVNVQAIPEKSGILVGKVLVALDGNKNFIAIITNIDDYAAVQTGTKYRIQVVCAVVENGKTFDIVGVHPTLITMP